MACGCGTCRLPSSCLGRCGLPKHRCLDKEEIKPGPVPRFMGWLWDAKNAPEHQLKCGWRPGHISCSVLKLIDRHNSGTLGDYCGKPCQTPCSQGSRRSSLKLDCAPSAIPCAVTTGSCTKPICDHNPNVIKIARHGGKYTISTKPSNISNAPTGPYPLKYVIDVDPEEKPGDNVKYSVEAKFNDYHFDYTTSQTSFVLNFTPPDQKCFKPCQKKPICCSNPCPKSC